MLEGGSWGCSKPWTQFLQLGADVEIPCWQDCTGQGASSSLGKHKAAPLHHSSVCPPLPARLDCALTPLAPVGLRENRLHLSQPQFTKCQLQICDTWPLRNQLSFLMPGSDHKWDMISVAELSWSQRQHRAAHCCPNFTPTQTSALALCHELL